MLIVTFLLINAESIGEQKNEKCRKAMPGSRGAANSNVVKCLHALVGTRRCK